MTFPEGDSADRWTRPLLLVGCGLPAELEQWLAAAAPPLAAWLDLPLQRLGGEPASALAALQAAGPTLAWLPLDPGCWQGGCGTWVEALGAWRQPTLALIPAPQLAAGQAAALTALLRQERVPLLGLLQLGGEWQAEARRADALPWLGHWPADSAPGAAEAEAAEAALDALELVMEARLQELLAQL
ncbi:MAG: hypothetical protein R6W06_14365 [Prochlorococcaceae cyanobacterium]